MSKKQTIDEFMSDVERGIGLAQYIAANEFTWWHEKLTQSAVRKLIKQNTGHVIPRVKGAFKDFCAVNMSIYLNRSWRRKPTSTNLDLTADQWDKLKTIVEKLKPQIEGQGITVAFDVIRTKISTSPKQLIGLRKRMHYWDN
jgi:hypothetical protein